MSTEFHMGMERMVIKNRFPQHWKQRRVITVEDTSLRELERWQQTTISRLRTGHYQLLSHMYRLSLSHTHECPCGTGVQDPQHILQNCPTRTREGTRLWPSGSDFRDKLWGSKEDLQTTANVSPICTASAYLTHMSARVELVFKTHNTSCKTVQPIHGKEHACGHLGPYACQHQ